jgi:putative transposase
LKLRSQKKREVGYELEARLPKASKSIISKVLGIPKRNLYNQNTKQSQNDLILKDQILKVLELNPSYGHRRIALALEIGKKRARRVMKLFGIKPYKRKARWTKKKDYGNPDSGCPNLIKGSCPIKPNMVFAGDFTRLIWNQRIIYLATFIDLYTREIVGWSISTKHTTEFVIEAYLDAVRTVGKSIIVHSDQGSEYNSKEYTDFMKALGVKISMSAKASPWENGYQESFYDNFKTDLGLEFERFETVGEFVEAIHKTVNYYNKERIHTKLKMSPVKFKLRFLSQTV